MSWMQTFTGKKFQYEKTNSFEIKDIAHSLSMLCRFNGHCKTFYSVAEHSLRVASIVEPHLALDALLHDATEAYMTDLPRPIKLQMPSYLEIEQKLMKRIADFFQLQHTMPTAVKKADNILLATEKRDLMNSEPDDWKLVEQPLIERIRPLPQQRIEKLFLDTYYQIKNNLYDVQELTKKLYEGTQ